MKIPARLLMAVAVISLSAGCANNQSASNADDNKNVMDVVAPAMVFQAPDMVPAGWVTIRFRNQSPMVHFALVEKLPEGITVKEQQEQAAPIFQAGMDLLNAGREDDAMAKFGELPEWFGKLVFLGGVGLTGSGHTSEATIHLDPGTYLLECYVKTAGTFHSYNPEPGVYGMVHQFTVTSPPSPAPEPKADMALTLSSTDGITVDGEPKVGQQTIAVHFADQKTYENFSGHDVHLVRLKDDTDMGKLIAWMDWRQKDGLQTPAPAEFLGGLNDMPAGETGYFTVSLEPGRYAWIAEVPDAEAKGFLKVFTVAADGS